MRKPGETLQRCLQLWVCWDAIVPHGPPTGIGEEPNIYTRKLGEILVTVMGRDSLRSELDLKKKKQHRSHINGGKIFPEHTESMSKRKYSSWKWEVFILNGCKKQNLQAHWTRFLANPEALA